MKLDLNHFSDVDVVSTTEEKEITLSQDSQVMFFQMFTKNIYSNPIGSVVREITSNCFDSHVEARVNKPVLIKLSTDNQTNTKYISFIDFGVGMSPDRINNIFSIMLTSTKRDDNDQIGGFGLGSKTPLAYKRPTGLGVGEYDNSYQIITNYNGIKYIYLIYEGKKSPMISLIDYDKTTDCNGTEIKIPVLEKDLNTFAKEMVRQLYYFENVIFEGFENTYQTDTLSNSYQIMRGKTFLFRGGEYSSNMHVCLGRVAYPIDYNVLGLSASDYRLPIGLRLEVGDINVIASREQLDYSEKTIKVLKQKLEIAKDEVKQLLAKQYENIVTLKQYFNVKSDFGQLVFANGMSFNIGNLITQKDIDFSNFKYSFMKMPNDKQLFKFFFEPKVYGKKTRSRYGEENFNGGYDELKRNNNLYFIEGEFVRKVSKQSYLTSLHKKYFVIERRNVCSPFMRSEIAELFNVHVDKLVDDNGKPTDFIQSLIDMQEEYFEIVRENASDYDNVEIPAEFLVRKKRNVLTDELRNTTMPVKLFGSYGKVRMKLDVLIKFKSPIFYGTQEDEYSLQTAHTLFKKLFDNTCLIERYNEYNHTLSRVDKNKGMMFIMVSKGNEKYIKFCPNAIHISKFYNRMLYRKADIVQEYFQTYNIVEKYDQLKDLYTNPNFSQIDAKWGKVIKGVNKFINDLPKKKVDLSNHKNELSRFFKLDNLGMTNEQQKFAKQVEELKKLEVLNSDILGYINTWRFSGNLDSTLVEILRKIMIL